jgi:hypothetical protein
MIGSAVVWEGPSAFDAMPVVAIVTGMDGSSHNPKTGPMAQLWILRSDLHPQEAIKNRSDYSVCADCPLRGEYPSGDNRVCYVKMNPLLSIFRAFKAGSYRRLKPSLVAGMLQCAGRSIRLGAYGEPTAVPVHVLADLTNGIRWTGYTHQWRDVTAQHYRSYLMASVESDEQRQLAHKLGWRTFRTRLVSEQLDASEITCPASAEAFHRTTCDKCNLCNGERLGVSSIAIIAHGTGKAHFVTLTRRS